MTARKQATRARTTSTTQAAAADLPDIDVFAEYRARAASTNLTITTPTNGVEPLTLGEEDGFDPPLTIDFPSDPEKMYVLDRALRGMDIFGALEVLLGGEQDTRRVLRWARQADDWHVVLTGLLFRVTDHFLGKGAADVPGGSQPS